MAEDRQGWKWHKVVSEGIRTQIAEGPVGLCKELRLGSKYSRESFEGFKQGSTIIWMNLEQVLADRHVKGGDEPGRQKERPGRWEGNQELRKSQKAFQKEVCGQLYR